MRFGCCLNMIASQPDGTGMEYIEQLAEIGYDYVELPLAEMMALSENDFENLKERIKKSGVNCEVCNNFFSKTIRLTGPDVNIDEILQYVESALKRASSLGVEYVIFGSGGAKNVPMGYPLEKGYQQVVFLLKQIAPIAKRNNITICIEPLRKEECNLINTFKEGCNLTKDVNDGNIRVLVDYYHMSVEQEPVENIRNEAAQYLRHVHFARHEGREYPKSINEDSYQPFIDALKGTGYNSRVSCEAYTDDFIESATQTLEFFKENF